MAEQLDLFAPADVPADARRLVDGLTCLRDAVPEAMDVVIHLDYGRSKDDGGFCLSGDWAYTIRRAGLRYERRRDWGGRVADMRCVTWAELADLLGGDPRRAELIAWADSLGELAWKERTRPHELWPNPGHWHPSYIKHDHEHPGWDRRIAAWRTLQAILTDAIARLDPTGGESRC